MLINAIQMGAYSAHRGVLPPWGSNVMVSAEQLLEHDGGKEAQEEAHVCQWELATGGVLEGLGQELLCDEEEQGHHCEGDQCHKQPLLLFQRPRQAPAQDPNGHQQERGVGDQDSMFGRVAGGVVDGGGEGQAEEAHLNAGGQHHCDACNLRHMAYGGDGKGREWKTVGEGVEPNQGELSESVGGTFGGLTLFNTATYHELLDCNQSKAHHFKEDWEGKMMQIGV